MKLFSFDKVELKNGYMYNKQELNRKITINSVYDRFYDTGRITAFDFKWRNENTGERNLSIYLGYRLSFL